VLAPAERPAQKAILAEHGPPTSPGGDRSARSRILAMGPRYFFFGAGVFVAGTVPVKVPLGPGLTV
jgi:hypothetical protein